MQDSNQKIFLNLLGDIKEYLNKLRNIPGS